MGSSELDLTQTTPGALQNTSQANGDSCYTSCSNYINSGISRITLISRDTEML